ncbi:hypothetical protein [Halalkalicoccus salilacus]|uniref:hypothetical protein n=1 Tax=Halalkalicoccus TaxID=332246 RepID=UPI002F96716A
MSDSGPAPTMAERVGGRWTRMKLYILLTVNRELFTALLGGGMFLSLLVLGTFAEPSFRSYMIQYDPSRYVFQAYITALFTGVTLVVTLSQLVLSQELGPLGSQRQQMSKSMSFRGDVEQLLEDSSPAEPAAFLRALIDTSRTTAEALQEEVADHSNDELEEQVETLVDNIVTNAETVSDEIEDRTFGEYAVVKAALDYAYSWKIDQARRIRDTYIDDLSDEAVNALIDLVDILSYFGPAREHIKTLYFQWELVNLSREMLYLAIPALVVSSALASYLTPTSFSGATLGISHLLWINSAGITISSLPFLLLAVYVFRLATIAKRTLAIGPFILR